MGTDIHAGASGGIVEHSACSDERQWLIYRQLVDELDIPTDVCDVAFTGNPDPHVASIYPVAEGLSAIMAAIGTVNAELWVDRGGDPQTVTVDRAHAIHHFHSVSFIRQNGYLIELKAPTGPTSLTHRTKDGRFIETTTTLPHLQDGILRLLNCVNTTASCDDAFRQWDAQELEDAINGRGLCGAMHRSRAQWRAHPQGELLAQMPVISITKIGDTEPIPLPPAERPLTGVRVLDFTHIIAGPMIGSHLAEQGADVLRIDPPEVADVKPNLIDTGHGKLSAFLDLDRPADVTTALRLAADADVVVQSYAPHSIGRRGLSPQALAQQRPGTIYVDVSAYGQAGPWGARRGWENIAQACTGVTVEHGAPDAPMLAPVRYLTDYSTGALGALGALVALLRRSREGGSYHVQVSLCRTAMWFQDLPAVDPSAIAALGTSTVENQFAAASPYAAGVDDSVALIQTSTPWGVIDHLAPLLQYSQTPSRWDRPSPIPGSHPASWPE